MTSSPKRHWRPETLLQAARWDSRANFYEARGLCRPCAGQAAHGASIGWGRVRPPCPQCAPIVAQFPNPQHNGWRSLKVRRSANTVPARTDSTRPSTVTL
jgi:hypothetical protein